MSDESDTAGNIWLCHHQNATPGQCCVDCGFMVGLWSDKQVEDAVQTNIGVYQLRNGESKPISQVVQEIDELDSLRQRIAELEAEAAALRAVVRQVEWGDVAYEPETVQKCTWCGGPEILEAHADDCSRQAALASDAGQRLLEAARELAKVAHNATGAKGDIIGVSRSQVEKHIDTLRELGVIQYD